MLRGDLSFATAIYEGLGPFHQSGHRKRKGDLRPLAEFIISADDLVASKLASGRPQDLADADAIRKATESQALKPTKEKTFGPTAGSGSSQ
jgi:hypothetical protein